MRILIIVTGLPDQQNPARSVYNLNFVKGLKKKGIEVSIIYLRAIHYKRNIIVEKEIDGIKCLEVGCTIPRIGIIKSTIFLKPLFLNLVPVIRAKLNGSFDVVHAVGGDSLQLAYNFAKMSKTPLVLQFIGSDININLKNYLKKKDFIKGMDYAQLFAFNSKALKIEFEKSYSIKKQMEVIYRGIDLEKYTFNHKDFSKGLEILFLGGFPSGNLNLKGGETLLKMIKMLDYENLKRKISFRIAGPNSNRQKNIKVNNNNLDLNFLGSINMEDVQKELENSHVVIIPSLAEGTPNVLYESMAKGNCIMASEIGGIPEIITNGQDGILFPADRPELLLNHFLGIYSDSTKLEEYSQHARRKIEKLDYNLFLMKYIEIYRKVKRL